MNVKYYTGIFIFFILVVFTFGCQTNIDATPQPQATPEILQTDQSLTRPTESIPPTITSMPTSDMLSQEEQLEMIIQARGGVHWAKDIQLVITSFEPVPFYDYLLRDTYSPTPSLGNSFISYYQNGDEIYYSNKSLHPTKTQLPEGDTIWESDTVGKIIGLSNEASLVYDQDKNRLYGLSNDDGTEKWMIILNSLVESGSRLYVADKGIPYESIFIIPTNMGSLLDILAVDIETGETKYSIQGEQIVTLSQDVLVTISNDSLRGRNPLSSEVIWGIPYNGDGSTPSFLDINEGIIYKINERESRDVSAFEIDSGSDIWEGTLTSINNIELGYIYQLLTSENYMIIASENSEGLVIYIIDKETGRIYDTIQQDREYIAYITESNILMISYPELGTTLGINLTDKQIEWENLDLDLSYVPYKQLDHVIVDDVMIFTQQNQINNSNVRTVNAIDTLSGELLWSIPAPKHSDIRTINDIPYTLDTQHFIHFFDPEQGEIVVAGPIGDGLLLPKPYRDNLWLIQAHSEHWVVPQLQLISIDLNTNK